MHAWLRIVACASRAALKNGEANKLANRTNPLRTECFSFLTHSVSAPAVPPLVRHGVRRGRTEKPRLPPLRPPPPPPPPCPPPPPPLPLHRRPPRTLVPSTLIRTTIVPLPARPAFWNSPNSKPPPLWPPPCRATGPQLILLIVPLPRPRLRGRPHRRRR